MRYFNLLVIFIFSTQVFAAPVYLKKLIDEKDKSVLFMTCDKSDNCKVLGGGSISENKIALAMQKIQHDLTMRNVTIIGVPTVGILLNPCLMMAFFINVPAGLIAIAGATAYVVMTNDRTTQYKQIKLLDNKIYKNITEEQILESLDKILYEMNGVK